MPQNQPSGKGLMPSPTAWSPDQHHVAMSADDFYVFDLLISFLSFFLVALFFFFVVVVVVVK